MTHDDDRDHPAGERRPHDEAGGEWPHGLLILAGLYVGFFALTWVDEVLLKTRLLQRYTPPQVVDLLRTLYWPLLVLLRR